MVKQYQSLLTERDVKPALIKKWQKWFAGAPDSVAEDAVVYWRNMKFLWNNREINLKKQEIDDITAIQNALTNLKMDKYNKMMQDMKAAKVDTGK